MNKIKTLFLTVLIMAFAISGIAALNRHANVEHNTDGTHKMTDGAAGVLYYHDGTRLVALPAGATTKILVGGGAGAPVWTEATGSGAPVRQTSPTLVTPALGTPASGDLRNCTAATTTNKGVTVYSGSTKALAGTDTASAMTPADTAAAQAVVSNPKAMSQGVAMTYAASGSSGIQVADNANLDSGTGNFTIVSKVSLPLWTSAAVDTRFFSHDDDGNYSKNFSVSTAGKLYLYLRNNASPINNMTTASHGITDGTQAEVACVFTNRSASVAGSVAYYINGVLFETVTVVAGTPITTSVVATVNILGTSVIRYAGTVSKLVYFNRALTAAEVLDLYRNGVAVKHRKASQTALTSGALVTGQEYTIDTFVAGDDFANVGGTNETGNVFVATGTTPTTWTNSSSLRATGGTLILEPEGIQPAPGQWLDSSSNKLHAMLPASGASLTRYKKDFEYRWTNTWTASSAAQYVGGLNQAVLSADHFITNVITQATVTTDVENLELGDGSAVAKFVAAFTPSATRTSQTIAAQNDGTNLKLVYTPAAEATMRVETIIRGFIWEP
jgi:hypothetical protein